MRNRADPSLGPAIIREATRLGIDPVDLATAIGYETVGSFSTDIRGGAGNKYYGLIQFGPREQTKYGIVPGMTADEQMKKVGDFLQDRKLQPGSGLLDIYSTINAGSPGHYGRSDASGKTVRQHVAEMQRTYGPKAQALLAGGDLSGMVDTFPSAEMPEATGVTIDPGYTVIGGDPTGELEALAAGLDQPLQQAAQPTQAVAGFDQPVTPVMETASVAPVPVTNALAISDDTASPGITGQDAIASLLAHGDTQVSPPPGVTGTPLPPEIAMAFAPPAQPPLPYVSTPPVYTPSPSMIQPYSTQPAYQPNMQLGYSEADKSAIAGGVGDHPGPAVNPMAGQYYPELQPEQLPLAPSDQPPTSMQMGLQGVPGEMSQMPATDPAAHSLLGGVLGKINKGIETAKQSLKTGILPNGMPISAATALMGVTGLSGPTPSGVTDRATGSQWLQAQQWHPADLFTASGGINPSGGAAFPYFSPATPGGIGGYVSGDKIFTYPTDPDIYTSVAS